MSGLRSTSAVGSGWNSVLGETARDMANRFRTLTRDVDTWQIVRGDDTQVVSDYYLDVLAVKLGYDALGAGRRPTRVGFHLWHLWVGMG
ncbi:hypothetical protein MTO96_052189 [Rhipicephalus appendiculatus]